MSKVEINAPPEGVIPPGLENMAAMVTALLDAPALRNASNEQRQRALISAFFSEGKRLDKADEYSELAVKAGAAWFAQRRASSNPETPQQEREVTRLSDMLIAVVASEHHAIALEALLLVFRTLAKKHTCCLEGSAIAAGSLAVHLQQVAALGSAPTDGRVH